MVKKLLVQPGPKPTTFAIGSQSGAYGLSASNANLLKMYISFPLTCCVLWSGEDDKKLSDVLPDQENNQF